MIYPVIVAAEHANTYRTDNGVLVVWHWCNETFGHPNEGNWWYGDAKRHRTFYFTKEADAVLFALKWA